MILAIKKYFEEKMSLSNAANEGENNRRMELATAALMFELLKVDGHFDEREVHTISNVLGRTFALDRPSIDAIIALAEEESHRSTSLYDFTSLVNSSYDYPQRVQLVENLWRVAFADHKIDRYEDNLIRRIADLIYVSHTDFIKCKLKVRDAISITQV